MAVKTASVVTGRNFALSDAAAADVAVVVDETVVAFVGFAFVDVVVVNDVVSVVGVIDAGDDATDDAADDAASCHVGHEKLLVAYVQRRLQTLIGKQVEDREGS